MLSSQVGLPHFDWPHHTPRTCERFGEAYATFAHTDLRVAGLTMYNIWVPLAAVHSAPLLLFAASSAVEAPWWRPQDKACHLPSHEAAHGDWYIFPRTSLGQAIIFPGDGGRTDGCGLFHGAAWEEGCERQSFDVREFVVPAAPMEEGGSDARAPAEQRLAAETAAWQSELEAAPWYSVSP